VCEYDESIFYAFMKRTKWKTFFPFCIVVLGQLHCGIYRSSYNISDISYLNESPPYFLFVPTHPMHGTVSTDIIFPCVYMCTQHFIFLHLFPTSSPLPLVGCVHFPWYNIRKEKRRWKKCYFCCWR
jgi:hypothetical protein